MATTLDFESDQFLELLTDALRAGPGSPAWHQALLRLGTQTGSEAEQYRKLIDARERLESGREYRSVRAGAGFTAKIMRGIDEAASGDSRGGRMPSAGSIAIGSAVVGLGVLGVLMWFLFGGGGPGEIKSAETLANEYFGQTVLVAPMTGSVPAGWRQIGKLPLDMADGELKPGDVSRPGGSPGRGGGSGPAGGQVGGAATTSPSSNRGGGGGLRPGGRGPGSPGWRGDEAGGIVTETPISPREPFEMLVTLRFDQAPEDFIPEVFVADSGDFNDQATSAGELSELTWVIQNRRPQVVLPNGIFAGKSDEIKDGHGTMTVKLVIDGLSALAQTDGRTVWSGALGLTPQRPLYLGVTFRRSGIPAAKPSHLAVESISVLEP